MQITIDGASSCLAQELGYFFEKDNHKVNYISRSKSKLLAGCGQTINPYHYDDIIKTEENQKSLFVQLACATPNNSTNPDEIYQDNSNINKNIQNHLRLNNYDYLANISTMSVYGNITGNYISNLSTATPIDNYGRSKLLIEKTIQSFTKTSYQYPKRITLRLPGLISRKTQNIFLAKCIQRITANEPINISHNENFNNATCSYDIYKTIVHWIEHSNCDNSASNCILNMHSSDIVKISDLLNTFALTLGVAKPNLVINSRIKSFTIRNEKYSDIPTLSPILDIVQPLLKGQQP